MSKNITHIDIPEDVSFIISKLEERGFEAYAVGGCVRDTLIGRIPGDWDITTSALPAEIKETFRRTVDTGIEHGTVTVLLGDSSYEVTTYRIDGEYRDNRHPERVSFTDSVREDLRRRDFTINAMAYNERTGILDLFGGKEDLENGIIRCVGDADERFDEDALRILRAVRFAAQLDFDIEKKTAAAITGHAENLEAVSRERILTEISKLICSAHPEKISEIFELGLAAHISDFFEEINLKQLDELAEINKSASCKALSGYKNPYINDDRTDELNHAFILSEAVPLKLRFVRFAYLCEGMAAEHVKKLLKGLKPDNDTLKYTVLLAEQLLKPLPTERYELKRLMSKTEPELFYCLLRLKELSAGTLLYKENIKASDEPENLTETRLLYEDILEKGEPVYLRELALTGGDLIKLGVKPGPELGRLLSELLDAVHREPAENNTADLSELVQINISQHTKNSQI